MGGTETGEKQLTPGYSRARKVISEVSVNEGGQRTNLAGNTSGDDDDVSALESLVELVGGVAGDLAQMV